MNTQSPLLPPEQGQPQPQAQRQAQSYSTPASLTQFYVNPQELIYNQNPLADLAQTNFAIVHIKYPCCTFCSGLCGFTYNFDTYLSSERGTQYLFRSVSKIDCSICCVSDIISRFGKCISYGKSSYDQYQSGEGTPIVELDRNKNCACYGCYDVLMDVNILSENKRRAGVLKIRTATKDCCKCDCKCCVCCACLCGDCYNYSYCCEILSPENVQKYVILEKRCCLSCATGKKCGLSFNIYDSCKNVLGSIEGNGKCCGGEYTFKVTFPGMASVEDKLCILNAVYAIDTFSIY